MQLRLMSQGSGWEMTPTHLTLALLGLSPLTLAASPYLGSPWPGVALAALALLSHGLGEVSTLRGATGQAEALARRIEALEDDVRSLKNRAAMKNFGGG